MSPPRSRVPPAEPREHVGSLDQWKHTQTGRGGRNGGERDPKTGRLEGARKGKPRFRATSTRRDCSPRGAGLVGKA